jgi:hypothetical protein
MAGGWWRRLLISIRAALQLAEPLHEKHSGLQQPQQQALGRPSSSSNSAGAAANAVKAASASAADGWDDEGLRAALADQRVAVFRCVNIVLQPSYACAACRKLSCRCRHHSLIMFLLVRFCT